MKRIEMFAADAGRRLAVVACLLAGLVALPAPAQVDPADLLPVDEAFALESAVEGDELVLDWRIAEGYYLYRHAMRFEPAVAGLTLGEADMPAGERTVDEFFGETETWRDALRITLPLEALPGDGRIEVDVHSQGCADVGVCYPPHRQRISHRAVAQATSPPAGQPAQSPLTGERPGSTSGLSGLLGESGALPAGEAFTFEAIADSPSRLLVRFIARPDYYLYREQFDFSIAADDIEVVQALLPAGETITDEFFGRTEVYYGEVEIPVELSRPAGAEIDVTLQADFQGCWEEGICYPPMSRELEVTLPAAERAVRIAAEDEDAGSAPAPVSEQDRLAAALGGEPLLAMGLFMLAGILLAFTPCVFPMVPILSGLIAGEGERITTARAFRLSLVYVLAMALVYTAFGVVAGLFGQNLQAVFQHPAVLTGFAALFVVLSLAMFGFYDLQLPASWQTKLNEWSNRAEGGTLLGAAIMGALSALIVGPCVAPALMGALIYIGQTGDAVLGGAALFAMAIGMGIPLIVWGTSAGKLLPRAGTWMNAVKAVFGVGLLALAVWMLERIVPPAATMLLWGALAIACGVYLGALTRLDAGVSGWRKLWQALGVMLLVLGIAQFIGAASGGSDWTRPLGHLRGGAVADPQSGVSFREIESLDALQAAIAQSAQPVLLDFYADWCVDCVRMERRTFTDAAVAERLAGFTLIKVDVTDYNEAHQAMLGHFDLIGPPAYLFFVDGRELGAHRTFGYLPPARFAALLDEVAG